MFCSVEELKLLRISNEQEGEAKAEKMATLLLTDFKYLLQRAKSLITYIERKL